MKQSRQVSAFKNELRSYSFYLQRIEALQTLIDLCYHNLSGVHAIDPSKIPMGGLPNKDLEYRIRDEIERHERNKAFAEANVEYVDRVLGRIETPLREAIISVYVKGNTTRSVADKLYLSHTALQKRINRAIEEALDV